LGNVQMDAMREQRRMRKEALKLEIEGVIAALDSIFGGRKNYSVNTETGEISYEQGSLELPASELTYIKQASEKLGRFILELNRLNSEEK